VEIAGVDVGDAEFDGFAQHRQGLVAVPGRAEDAGPGQLHGAKAHAADDEVVREPESPTGNTVYHVRTLLESISNVAVAVVECSAGLLQPQRCSWEDVECGAWRGIPRGRAGA